MAAIFVDKKSENSHMLHVTMFFVGRESTVTGFPFLALNKNRLGYIIRDPSDSIVKRDCGALIQFQFPRG